MELVFDLRSDQLREDPGPDRRILDYGTLHGLVRHPRAMAPLLWRTRYEAVIVLEESIPKTVHQAGALVIASLARGRRRVLAGPEGERRIGWAAMLLHAIGTLTAAIPRESWGMWQARGRLRAVIARPAPPEGLSKAPRSAIYLRGETTLHWRGSFVGGAATHTAGVINALVARGVETVVFARQELPGVNAPFQIVPLRRLYHLDPWIRYADYSEELLRASERDGVRADFVYQRYATESYAGLELARRLEVPFVLEYNGSFIWETERWGERPGIHLGRRLREDFEAGIVRAASLNVVVSKPLRDELLARGVRDDRILVNPNGVDIARLKRARERPPGIWRAEHGLPDAPTVGFIGTFGRWHGVELLPSMIAELGEIMPAAHWILVGDGPLFEDVRSEIQRRALGDRVHMPGSTEHERATELMAASDVCVSPHVPNPDGAPFVGSPTKIFEYMGLGKAIVASNLGQIGEVLKDESTGLLTEPGNAAEATAAVALLLRDAALRTRLGTAAFEQARKHHTWDAHVHRILCALQERCSPVPS